MYSSARGQDVVVFLSGHRRFIGNIFFTVGAHKSDACFAAYKPIFVIICHLLPWNDGMKDNVVLP